MKTKQQLKKITLCAMFITIGLLLPFLTGQIPQIGTMLLPMHIPVFLAGLICGWMYGAVAGFVVPLLRCLLFGVPIIYPNAIAMAFELCTYGLVAGYLYNRSKWQCIFALYRSMLCAMIMGRLTWGIAEFILLGIKGTDFTLSLFISGAFIKSFPGIILQLIFIPALMIALNRTGLVKFRRHKQEKSSQHG